MSFIKRCFSTVICLAMVAGIFTVACVNAGALTPTYNCSSSYKKSDFYKELCKVQLTGDPAEDIVNVALSQVGYHEGNSRKELDGSGVTDGTEGGNFTEYAYFFNNGSTAYGSWCAYFVNWCARQAGISTKILYGLDGYVPNILNYYKQSINGEWHDGSFYGGDYVPVKGDIVIFDFNYDYNDGDHIGIVRCDAESVDLINVVGGNEGDAVHDGIFSSEFLGQRNTASIVGFFHPNYALNKIMTDPTNPANYPVPTQAVKNGSTGESVKWVQSVLYTFGYLDKASDIDGKFGKGTEAAVMEFQKNEELEVDGIVGMKTIELLEKMYNDYIKSIQSKTASLSRISEFSMTVDSTLGLVENPEEYKAAKITFTSSDETIATVDENGVVTGLKEGTVIITAKYGDQIIASYSVTIEEAPVTLRYGDVNCDGDVNMEDVTDLQRILADLASYTNFGDKSQAQSDVTRDFDVTMTDIVYLQQVIAEIIEID